MASKEAFRVQVSVRGDSTNQSFRGVQAAGHWWPIDFPATHVLEDDEGATGIVQADEATGQPKQIFTLKQKMDALSVLEGRRKENGRWSAPGFPLEDVPGNQNKAAAPTAPTLAVVKILDTRDANGVWESEKNKGASKSELIGAQGSQGQQGNGNGGKQQNRT